MRVLAVIEDAVTVLEVAMNHFLQGESPSQGFSLLQSIQCGLWSSRGELLPVSMGCRAKGTAGLRLASDTWLPTGEKVPPDSLFSPGGVGCRMALSLQSGILKITFIEDYF